MTAVLSTGISAPGCKGCIFLALPPERGCPQPQQVRQQACKGKIQTVFPIRLCCGWGQPRSVFGCGFAALRLFALFCGWPTDLFRLNRGMLQGAGPEIRFGLRSSGSGLVASAIQGRQQSPSIRAGQEPKSLGIQLANTR